MSQEKTIADLRKAIEQAQILIAALENPLTSEGWSALKTRGIPPTTEDERHALRHGCTWNQKERRDLVAKWLQFTSVERLAQTHRRTESSVRSELQRLLYTANPDVLLAEIVGTDND